MSTGELRPELKETNNLWAMFEMLSKNKKIDMLQKFIYFLLDLLQVVQHNPQAGKAGRSENKNLWMPHKSIGTTLPACRVHAIVRRDLGNFMNEELSDITKLLEKHGIKPIKKDSGLEIDKSRYELLREMEENEQKNYLFSILNNIDPMVCVLINRAIINFLYQKISERKD